MTDFDLSPTRHNIRNLSPFALRRITFDGRQDFREHYLLFGRDEAAIRRLFTPGVLDYLVAEPGWFVEGRGERWLVYRTGERIDPKAMPGFLERAAAIVDLLHASGD